jgi:hypothetical protein
LYSGLPCECAGLRAYLRKDYDNLLICELLCHSAPSPKVFEKYVEHLGKINNSKVVNMRFRGKDIGWKPSDCETVITLENGKTKKHPTSKDPYYRAFINGCISRPSCNNCKYVYDNRVGDITIGDCWGVQKAAPALNDNKGVNLLLLNNKKAEQVFDHVNDQLKYKKSTLNDVFIKNHKKVTKDKRQRVAFFHGFDHKPVVEILEEFSK